MKLLVVGDLIIDEYVFGTATRICPEAPVPVVVPEIERESAGGAGLVVRQLQELGADVSWWYGSRSVKKRVFAGSHLICRIDADSLPYDPAPFPDLSGFDAIIVSDYGKGAMTVKLADKIMRSWGMCFIDAKHHWRWYEGCVGLAFPNEHEAAEFKCVDRCVIKLGPRGCKFRDMEIPATVSDVVDVTGAGDIFMASFAYAHTHTKLSPLGCLKFANECAGESCRHRGTYVVPKAFAQSILDRLLVSEAPEQSIPDPDLYSMTKEQIQDAARKLRELDYTPKDWDKFYPIGDNLPEDSVSAEADQATILNTLDSWQTPRILPSDPTDTSDVRHQDLGSTLPLERSSQSPISSAHRRGHKSKQGQD